jgi:choline monooxygenase
MDPAAYYDAAWFDREQAELFTQNWALAAPLQQVEAPGDFVTTTVGLAPLIVVRAPDGALRAFHNLCRHRGMALLEGSGHLTRTINCPYHQWRYQLDGALVAVPQQREQFADLDVGPWGLRPAAVAVWEGMVFVHPDPDAAPLTDALAGLPEHLGSYRPGVLRQVGFERISANCNWKLFVENHIDVYHLWYLHADSLEGFDHTRFVHRQIGRNWASYEPMRAGSGLTTGTSVIEHIDERDRRGLGAHMLFPNVLMATAAEFFATYVARPIAPDRTEIELRVRAEPDADPAALVGALRSFIDEDVAACEAVQRGVRSPWFEVGPTARDHEAPIARFHRHVLEALA